MHQVEFPLSCPWVDKRTRRQRVDGCHLTVIAASRILFYFSASVLGFMSTISDAHPENINKIDINWVLQKDGMALLPEFG
jgi:hypothetical protein